jgi:hypothetical protein
VDHAQMKLSFVPLPTTTLNVYAFSPARIAVEFGHARSAGGRVPQGLPDADGAGAYDGHGQISANTIPDRNCANTIIALSLQRLTQYERYIYNTYTD